MKTTALAIALLLGGAASAQADTLAYDGDNMATAAWETQGTSPTAMADNAALADAAAATTASGRVVAPSNADPEHDARGIAVISAAAVAPAGWNGSIATATGGPLLDPATGEAMAADSYPACTATVTDRCVQTYERGRR